MSKKLYMTSADYVAIAISPALIMALVGSLVYFLIEVMYVGEYQARLNYSFGLFVFAAVLIARISIEMGSEQATLYALPLGIAMFLFLVRFVEQPSAFGHVINLGLMGLVWWCAHKLTWDSTVIDDDEDASGEGLMQRIGVDDGVSGEQAGEKQESVAAGAKENELLEGADAPNSAAQKLWQMFIRPKRGPHTPGMWVLYFSLAALPLFGIGQHWIPVAQVGRRRYAFTLLLVYVASALALLVTTSFLNLRRYLRQRRVEMPPVIAGTWVGVGAVLIVIVMMLAALLPRPGAEVAISQVPWQAGSPDGLSASRYAVNRDGGEEQKDGQNATAGERTQDQQAAGRQQQNGGQPSQDNNQGGSQSQQQGQSPGQQGGQQQGGQQQGGQQQGGQQQGGQQQGGQQQGRQQQGRQQQGRQQQGRQQQGRQQQGRQQGQNQGQSQSQNNSPQNTEPKQEQTGSSSDQGKESGKSDEQGKAGKGESNENQQQPESNSNTGGTPPLEQHPDQQNQQQGSSSPPAPSPANTLQSITSMLGGLTGLVKIVFYAILVLLLAYGIWKYRRELMQALADILRALRELFGGKRAVEEQQGQESAQAKRVRTFAEFRDPFQSGEHRQMPPDELVRYTFAAFEAWSNDRGKPRAPDCTPQELVRVVLPPDSEMYTEARRLARLYSEAAYASARTPREAANELRELWQLMRETRASEVVRVG